MIDTLVMIMAGGKGERLHPLTRDRAKPAVPFGARYRIIDFVLSNFINSGFMRIKVLTQYQSNSLLVHLARGYNFGSQTDNYVDAVPAAQSADNEGWYRGTAHAIYMNLNIMYDENPTEVAVFGGDHIYKMDVRQMLDFHRCKGAACTVACLPYDRRAAAGQFGIIEVDEHWRIIGFEEKPADPKPIPGRPELALVSMGNYFFQPEALSDALIKDNDDPGSQHDFGKNVLPRMVAEGYAVYAYDFLDNRVPGEDESGYGYWRDVGTIESYYEASMDLRAVAPKLNLYNYEWPIRSTLLQYPPVKFVFDEDGRRGMTVDSIVANGTVVSGGCARNSIISNNVFIHSGAELDGCILFNGCNIGRNVRMRNVICDKNVTIEDGTVIGEDAIADVRFTVSPTGILLIPKNAVVPKEGELRSIASAPPPGSIRPRLHQGGSVRLETEARG
jgi:glucose-1-phosphate adenylyltransferase